MMPKRIDKTKFDEIERMLSTGGLNCTEIAAEVGVHGTLVEKIKRGEHYFQSDFAERDRRGGNHGETYIPTALEIELACARIRAAQLPVDDDDAEGWRPPAVDASALRIA